MPSLKALSKMISFILMLALFGASGATLGVAQCFAWVRMAKTFMKQDSPRIAIQKTLDDKHPCHICHEIKRANKRMCDSTPEQDHNPIRNNSSLEVFTLNLKIKFDLYLDSKELQYPFFKKFSFALLNKIPPTPPPRIFS